MKRLLVTVGVLLFLASAWGIAGPLMGERYLVAWDPSDHRPLFLRFGPPARIGACTTRETDDPESNILANLLDVDGDGRGDVRMSANHLGTKVTCETRRFGLWVDAPDAACRGAAEACRL